MWMNQETSCHLLPSLACIASAWAFSRDLAVLALAGALSRLSLLGPSHASRVSHTVGQFWSVEFWWGTVIKCSKYFIIFHNIILISGPPFRPRLVFQCSQHHHEDLANFSFKASASLRTSLKHPTAECSQNLSDLGPVESWSNWTILDLVPSCRCLMKLEQLKICEVFLWRTRDMRWRNLTSWIVEFVNRFHFSIFSLTSLRTEPPHLPSLSGGSEDRKPCIKRFWQMWMHSECSSPFWKPPATCPLLLARGILFRSNVSNLNTSKIATWYWTSSVSSHSSKMNTAAVASCNNYNRPPPQLLDPPFPVRQQLDQLWPAGRSVPTDRVQWCEMKTHLQTS